MKSAIPPAALLAGMVLTAPAAAHAPDATRDSTQDLTQEFLAAPNFPVSDQAPTERVPALPDGLALAPGATSKAALVFTPGGSTDSRAKLDAQVYYNPIFGNQAKVTGNDGIEGDTASNFTRARRYAAGSRFDLLNFTRDGLDLDTVCSQDNTPAGCTPGHVYGAMIRLPTVILPGDIVSLTMRTGNSRFFYTGAALYAAVQATPGPGHDPYNGTGALHYADCYGEIDITDDYAVSGIPVGHQLKMGAVAGGSYAANPGGRCFRHAPHQLFDAGGGNFIYHPNNGHPYSETRNVATFAGFHTYTVWITGDGSHLLQCFFDGRLVSTQYYEPALSTYLDRSGHTQRVGYSLVVAAQTIPVFLNAAHDLRQAPYGHIVPQDGGTIVGGPWSATLASVRIVHGAIAPEALAAARMDANRTDGEAYGGLRDPGP